MKNYLLLLIWLISIVSNYAQMSELKEQAMRAFAVCSTKHKLNIKEIEQTIAEGSIPREGTMKCFINCVMGQMGLIVDGKFIPEKSFQLNKLRFTNTELLDKANELTTECMKAVSIPEDNEDECLLALELASCAFRFAREHNAMELSI